MIHVFVSPRLNAGSLVGEMPYITRVSGYVCMTFNEYL
jgi:hypothetical protein